jgi:hypothetical protein
LQGNFLNISLNKIGTYPLQSIIEQTCSFVEEKRILITCLKECIDKLSLDHFGAHVVEKFLCCFVEDDITFIHEYLIKNFLKLANNNNGIRIAKKAVILAVNRNTVSILRDLIADNTMALIQNPYGNYTLQLAFEVIFVLIKHWHKDDFLPIIKQFTNRYTNLSMQKYSSNVLEKCFEFCQEALISFIEEVSTTNRAAGKLVI